MKRKLHYDVPLGACLLALMAFLWHVSNSFVYKESTAMFPKIVIGVLACLSALLLIQGIQQTIEGAKDGEKENGEKGPSFLQRYGKPLLVYGMFVAYLLIFYFFNFFIATIIMLVGLMWYFGVRDWKPLVFVPVGFLAVAYFVFVNILHVKLL